MSITEVFPSKLLNNESFRADITLVWGADRALLEKVREQLPNEVEDLEDGVFLEEGSKACSVSREDFKRLSRTIKFLITAVATRKASSVEIVDYLGDEIQPSQDDPERRTLLSGLISLTPDEMVANAEVDAFAFGVTYRNVAVTPLIAPVKSGDRLDLRYGANIEIGYYTADSQQKTLSFNLSAGELEGLISNLENGLSLVSKFRGSIGGEV